ncbi:MAG: metalloregulator ArsR/SmtB family transcription factor [Cytophagales bacterium]|nr:metalloregulator ArsR/SmtB family transcription factor [Bernardetiaceae bacterium]MDW8203541.1 metalloregulator ArsR/SmtB family transcription factor [Cytophagales bacterium]
MQAKTEAFSTDLQTVAQYARLLSHPARVAIIGLLAEKKQCISGDIAEELPLSRSTVSQHLQELKQAGLIRGEVCGLHINYCLNMEKWQEVQQCFERFFNQTITSFHCTC